VKPFLILAVIVASAAFAAPALAAQPPNDLFANATQVDTLPFTDAVSITEATNEFAEPQWCTFSSQTVWYAYTPAHDALIRADLAGSDLPYTNLNFYRSAGGGLGSLSFVGCSSYGSPMTFRVVAGATYYFQAQTLFSWSGTIRFALSEILPPPNDDFASATVIGALPFAVEEDTVAAGVENGEPTPSCAGQMPAATIWFAYRPVDTASVSAALNAGFFPQPVAVYTGSSFADLVEIGCRNYGSSVLTWRAEAGRTYFLQVGRGSGCCGTKVGLSVTAASQPSAAFVIHPTDPSTYDTVEFWGQSSDPGQAGFVAERFDFGDGTGAEGCCPNVIGYPPDATHRYAADGDYVVTDTVTTTDGRMATAVETVRVRTHDVAIAKLTVPQSASADQTRTITVGMANARYPETVRVELLRSVAGARSSNRSVRRRRACPCGARTGRRRSRSRTRSPPTTPRRARSPSRQSRRSSAPGTRSRPTTPSSPCPRR
jgi:hypothetical protein